MSYTALWLTQSFLSRHDPTEAKRKSGTPLYAYGAKPEDKESLADKLRKDISQRNPFDSGFWAGYALFGAMVFSETEKVGRWTWETINTEIAPDFAPAHDEITDGIKIGAKFWHHTISDHGKKFIAYVLTQGGISVSSLNEDTSVFRRALNAASGILLDASGTELSDDDLAEHLLSTFENEISFPPVEAALLVARAAKFIFEASRHIYSQREDLRAELCKQYLSTRYEDFPSFFPDIDELTKVFVKQLKEVESYRSRSNDLFKSERYLRITSNDAELVTTVDLNTAVADDSQISTYYRTVPDLPSGKARLFIRNKPFAIVRKKDDQWVLDRVGTPGEPFRFTGESAWKALHFYLCTREGQDFPAQTPIHGMGAINWAAPVVFASDARNEQRWRYVGSGSVRTRAFTVYLIVPPGSRVEAQDFNSPDDTSLTKLDNVSLEKLALPVTGAVLWKISTSVRVINGSEQYRIDLKSEKESSDIRLIGDFLGTADNGIPLYRGIPEILSPEPLEVEWRDANGIPVGSPRVNVAEIYTIDVYDKNSDRRYKRHKFKVGVVPVEAKILPTITRNQDIAGSYRFKGFGNTLVELGADTPSCVTTARDSQDFLVNCPFQPNRPGRIHFNLIATNPDNYISISRAYPQESVEFWVAQEKQLNREETIGLDDVRQLTIKIVVSEHSQRDIWLVMRVLNTTRRHLKPTLYRQVHVNSRTRVAEISFNDFKDMYYRLRPLAKGQAVEVGVVLGSLYKIYVKEYSHKLKVSHKDYWPRLELVSSLKSHNYQHHETVRIELLPLDGGPNKIFDLSKHNGAVPTDELMRHVPFCARLAGDSHYRVNPVFFDGFLVDRKKLPSFLQIDNIWVKPLPREQSEMIRVAVAHFYESADRDDEVAIAALIEKLGPRGIVHLPIWQAFKGSTEELFSLAVALDVLGVSRGAIPVGDRLILEELSRLFNHRWDLMALPALERALSRVLKGKTDVQILALLTLIERLPMSLRAKFAYCLSKLVISREQWEIFALTKSFLDHTLYAEAMKGSAIGSEEFLRALTGNDNSDLTLQTALCRGLMERASEGDSDVKALGDYYDQVRDWFGDNRSTIEYFYKIIKPVFRKLFSDSYQDKNTVIAPLLGAYAFALGDSQNARLDSSESRFVIETLLSCDARWGQWCIEAADVLAEMFRNGKDKVD